MTDEKCPNIIEATGMVCGEMPAGGPFHQRFCSEECADKNNARELAEIGITPEMMREALEGYYECKDMIEKRAAATSEGPEPASDSPAESYPSPQAPL
jgi:hypothetical protein